MNITGKEAVMSSFPTKLNEDYCHVLQESYWKISIYVLFPTQLTAECCMV